MSLKKGKFQHHQSKSLWNYTLSPGWREEEVKILKSALQLFGIGKWKKILESGCLPGKSIGQIYMQTQRLLGQQSLGDFMGLQIEMSHVFNDNMKKQDVLRKNNCIINTGDNPTKEERKRRIEQNRKTYGLSQKELSEIRLPRVRKSASKYMTLEDIENEKFTNLEILTHLYSMREEIVSRLALSGDQEAVISISKGNILKKGTEETNQNSNSSSSEIKMTFESTGRKKCKLLSVEETLIPTVSTLSKAKHASKNKTKSVTSVVSKLKRNNKTKIDSEEDISLEDVDSKSSELSEDESDNICDDDEDDEEKEEDNEDEDEDEDEEEEAEEQLNQEGEEDDDLVINEEEIFEDDDDDEENPITSDEDYE